MPLDLPRSRALGYHTCARVLCRLLHCPVRPLSRAHYSVGFGVALPLPSHTPSVPCSGEGSGQFLGREEASSQGSQARLSRSCRTGPPVHDSPPPITRVESLTLPHSSSFLPILSPISHTHSPIKPLLHTTKEEPWPCPRSSCRRPPQGCSRGPRRQG